MNLLFAGLVGVVASECFLRLPFLRTGRSASRTAQKALRVIRSRRISDHWKEQALLGYSRSLFRDTLTLTGSAALVVLSVAPICAIALSFDREFLSYLARPPVLLYATILAMGYVAARKKKETSSYSFLDRALHRLALGNDVIAEASFDVEQILCRPESAPVANGQHVFVAGLARAGTTVLMRRLYATGALRSLTYRDMPFVLMPNIWRKVGSLASRKAQARERAHADGLLVDYDSPEALEEVFWRVFSGHSYIQEDALVPMDGSPELADKFRSYVAAILRDEKHGSDARYLSKNNNNILRLHLIKRAFPNAALIIPCRDPLQQSISLLNMHRRFVAICNNDAFVRRYMKWLVHHEFGSDHKPFRFGADTVQREDPNDINYWLGLWLTTYRWLFSGAPAGTLFLSYEDLCLETEKTWHGLATRLTIPSAVAGADTITLRKHSEPPTGAVNAKLLADARGLYAAIRSAQPHPD